MITEFPFSFFIGNKKNYLKQDNRIPKVQISLGFKYL